MRSRWKHDRGLLQSLVEEDETEIPFRSKHDPIRAHGIANVGKLLIIGAVELSEEGHPRRVRLEPLTDRSGESVRSFVERVVERGATVVSDGLAGYRKLKEHRHVGRTVGAMAAHVLLPWVHRAFANLKRWLTGTFHGVQQAAPRALPQRVRLPLEPPPPHPDGVRYSVAAGHPAAARFAADFVD